MGRRKRGNRSAMEVDREAEGEAAISKRPRLEPHMAATTTFRLSHDREERLGRWSSSALWIIKVAQDRGSNTCLAFVSSTIDTHAKGSCKLCMRSYDGQQISIVIRGDWVGKAASIFSRAGSDRMILLSGIGARVPSSGSEITFASGRMVFEIVGVDSFESQGHFEVADGQVVCMPRPVTPLHAVPEVIEIYEEIEGREESIEGEMHVRTSPPSEQYHASPFRTPLRDHRSTRQAGSETPAWLKTPATASHIGAVKAGTASSSRSESEGATSVHANAPRSTSRLAKMLGTRVYTPISLLECDVKVVYNVVGLAVSDHTARRSLSGTRDWKVTISLIEVEESKRPPLDVPVVPFNLFSRAEDWLPQCKPGCILLLRSIKVRPFNNAPQGSGYAGQFEWALMDTSEADQVKALRYSDNCALIDEERKEMKRQYDWYRKHHKGQLQAVPSAKHKRPLIKLCDVEKEVFFDTTVEIVKLWTGSVPPAIYVTDYSTHPQFYAANDVHLNGWSREELYEQQQECNDAGNGRVLPISLWDDQQGAIDFVHLGMVVRLENVRPKMQPNNYLGGTMGGSARGEEKMKVVVVKERETVEDFQQKREDYLLEIAARRAERLAAMTQRVERPGPTQEDIEVGNEEEHDDESGRIDSSSSNVTSLCIPSIMPPPGQKPLSAIINRSCEPSEMSSSANTASTQASEEEEMPTMIDETLSHLPLVSLSQLDSAPTPKQEETYVCLARVYDMLPINLDDIVNVVCGLCKSRLPADHAFCAQCAEEDGKELHYRFNFALLIEPVIARHEIEDSVRIPILVRGEEARHFLHGFHPKDVRNRKSTLDRLKQRLLPLLGSQLVYGKSASSQDQQKPHPFRLVIRATAGKGEGSKKYHLTGTRLGKL